jgi:hypothetical protein
MLRSSLFAASAGLFATMLLGSAACAESYTTRIEPRPFYGAIVTIEAGVRVFRPLPPERQIIINPNATPVSIGINDTRVVEHRVIENTGAAEEGRPGGRYYGAGWGIGNGVRGDGGHDGHGHAHGHFHGYHNGHMAH